MSCANTPRASTPAAGTTMFSMVKKLRNRPGYMFPDRTLITMDVPFLRAYVTHIINVCHRHGAYAMGGMAAQIPIRNDPAANAAALAKVRADKTREVKAGHDGTWVAHPGLVQTALDAFGEVMKGPNQLNVIHNVKVTAADLLAPLHGPITEAGLRWNLHVGVRYLEAWLGGSGAEPIHHLMEDLATAEISRSQLWQWLKFGAKLDDGRPVTAKLYDELLPLELAAIRAEYGDERYKRRPLQGSGRTLHAHVEEHPVRRVPVAAGVRAAALSFRCRGGACSVLAHEGGASSAPTNAHPQSTQYRRSARLHRRARSLVRALALGGGTDVGKATIRQR